MRRTLAYLYAQHEATASIQLTWQMQPCLVREAPLASAAASYIGTKMVAGVTLSFALNVQTRWTITVQTKQFGGDLDTN